jgi:DNA repair photolyase
MPLSGLSDTPWSLTGGSAGGRIELEHMFLPRPTCDRVAAELSDLGKGKLVVTSVECAEVRAKSALHRVQGMPFRWSLNPYQGCAHGCHYCYARRYHTYLDLNADADFSSKIFVKTNLPLLLRQELRRPNWGREHVSIGTATDPYQPIEGHYRITRQCLEAFLDYRSPAGVVTKGTLVVRDLDVLVDLDRKAGGVVCFSFCTLDETVWRRIEPGTSPPWQRLQAIKKLAGAGIPVGILLAPILPGISDSLQDLEGIVRAGMEHGARFIDAASLRLGPRVKEHFLGFLASEYPALTRRYATWYRGVNAPLALRERLEGMVRELKARYKVPDRPSARVCPLRQLELEL